MRHETLQELAKTNPEYAEELRRIEESIAKGRTIPISFNDGENCVPYIPYDTTVPDTDTILENIDHYTSGYVVERLCEYIKVLEETLRTV